MEKTFALEAKIDERMFDIVHIIKKDIDAGLYPIRDWNGFVETAILVLAKLLDNGITPLELDYFVEINRKTLKDIA